MPAKVRKALSSNKQRSEHLLQQRSRKGSRAFAKFISAIMIPATEKGASYAKPSVEVCAPSQFTDKDFQELATSINTGLHGAQYLDRMRMRNNKLNSSQAKSDPRDVQAYKDCVQLANFHAQLAKAILKVGPSERVAQQLRNLLDDLAVQSKHMEDLMHTLSQQPERTVLKTEKTLLGKRKHSASFKYDDSTWAAIQAKQFAGKDSLAFANQQLSDVQSQLDGMLEQRSRQTERSDLYMDESLRKQVQQMADAVVSQARQGQMVVRSSSAPDLATHERNQQFARTQSAPEFSTSAPKWQSQVSADPKNFLGQEEHLKKLHNTHLENEMQRRNTSRLAGPILPG